MLDIGAIGFDKGLVSLDDQRLKTRFGQLNGDADFSGRGNSVAALLATANFASEQLDLKVNPESKGLRLFSLRSPL